MRYTPIAAALAAAAIMATSAGAATLFAGGNAYRQDFDTLAAAGTSSATPDGWGYAEAGGDGVYAAGDGSSTAGGVYSFGTGADRAFGSLNTNAVLPVLTFTFTNGSASTITALAIAYNGEVWRFGGSTSRGGAIDRLDFAYAVGTGAFTDYDALDLPGYGYAGTVAAGALNGNVNHTALSATIGGLSIAAGQTAVLRWTDLNVAGSDDGLAIDDFGLTATFAAPPAAAVPEPASWAMMAAGFGLLGAAMRKKRAAAAFG